MAARRDGTQRTGARNRPVAVTWQDGATRLFNLVIGLLNAPTPRPTSWIIDNISGYQGQTESRIRTFSRDRKALSELGIVFSHERGEEEDLWLLRPEQVFLPDLKLSEQEMQVLATATQWARTPSEHPIAQSTAQAQVKLAGAGLSRLGEQAVVQPVPDLIELDQDSVSAIFRAIDRGLELSFWYYPSFQVEPSQRRIEPWAIGGVEGRLYLTGFDLDRNAQRTFRLSRISDAHAEAQFATHPVPVDPETDQRLPAAQLIREALETREAQVSAELLFRTGGGVELQDMCTQLRESADGLTGSIGPVDRDWLVRTAASYAPDVVVLSPPELAEEVMGLLHTAVKRYGTGGAQQTEGTEGTEGGAAQ